MPKKAKKSAPRKSGQAKASRNAPVLKTRILTAALPDVAFDGWSPQLLDRAAARLHLSPEEIDAALPGGVTDLVLHFARFADDGMLEALGAEKPDRIRDRIALAVRRRLEFLAPHKEAVRAAMAYMSLPPRSLHLPKTVWRTSDAIWRWAGDTATDYNHYTKRLLLSGVLTATGFYWLNDSSPGHEKTWAFLDRRIERVLKIGQALSKLKRKKA
jgi:ubiquinone biosynthesis protein COQ9